MAKRPLISNLVSLPARLQRKNHGESAAAGSFVRAAERAGSDSSLWFEAAKALEAAGDSRAEDAYRRATAGPASTSARLYRFGRFLEKNRRHQEALDAFVLAEKAGGPVGHLSFRQARCREALGDTVGAAAKFRRAAAADFDPKQCFIELDRLQTKRAPHWLRLQLAREGQYAFDAGEAWTLEHARLEAHLGFQQEAAELFEEVDGTSTLSVADLLLFHRALESLGRADDAREVLEGGVSRLPSKDQRLGPGVLFQKHGYWTQARAEYLRALSVGLSDPELVYRVGLSYDREYKWKDASEYFERAFSQRPSAAYWAYKAGHACERDNRFGDAAQWYQTALKGDSSKNHWWFRLGICLMALGMDDPAFEALEHALAIDVDARATRTRKVLESIDAALTDDVAAQGGRARIERWARTASGGNATRLPSTSDCVRLAELALDRGLTAEALELCRRPYLARVSLVPELRQRLAAVYRRAGESAWATEVLVASRPVRLPDGFTLSKYLPEGPTRRGRLYAEYVSTLAVDHRTVLLESNHGASAGCHPLALFREMLKDERFSRMTFVWAVNRPEDAPADVRACPRVRFVKVGSDEYLMHLATAGRLINNVSFPPYYVRRDDQRYLNTWHGTPMKTLGRSMKQGLVEYENLERNFIQASHLMAPNELTKWALLNEHHLDVIYPGSVAIVGSPRLDRLVNHTAELREDMRKRLEIPEGKRVVLVAPTWRGGVSDQSFDGDALVEELSVLAGVDDVHVLYRAHRLTEKFVEKLQLPVQVVPADIDTNELLAVVDHLVTDYSSIFFDFLVTGCPITLYVPDLDQYAADRGLYLTPDELPVSIARTVDELRGCLREGHAAGAEYAEAVAKYCPMEDGQASARCLDFFLSDDLKGGELDDKPIVLFHGSLIPNGIASSLLAILQELCDRGDVHVVLLVEPKVLRVAQDRAEMFERVPRDVRLISRLGDTLMTPEEYYLRGVVEGGRCEPGGAMMQQYWSGWRREARRITGDIPFDAAIEWDGYAVLWGGILGAVGGTGTRHLIWQHNDMVEEEENKYPELRGVFGMYHRFDRVVSVSEMLAATNTSRLKDRGVLPLDGVSSVPNSLLFDEIFDKASEPLEADVEGLIGEGGPLVLSIGRMSVEKNQEALIRSWPAVLADHPHAKLLIVGSGPLEDTLSALIETEGLSGSVHLTGQLRNPYPLIKRADLFVLPSLHEGQPVVLFESMALGVPIAASACPGSVEAMSLGYGATVSVRSDELGKSMSGLLADSSAARGAFDFDHYRKMAVERFSAVAGLAPLQPIVSE